MLLELWSLTPPSAQQLRGPGVVGSHFTFSSAWKSLCRETSVLQLAKKTPADGLPHLAQARHIEQSPLARQARFRSRSSSSQ